MSRRLKCTILTHVVRPSLTFHIFEFKETWQEARSQRPLPSLCVIRPIRKPRWPPRPLIETYLLCIRWTEFNKTWQEAISCYPQPSVCFGPIGKSRWLPRALIGRDIFRLLLCNRWMEFNETWQKASTQHPPSSLSFSGWSLSAGVAFQREVLRCTIVTLWPLVLPPAWFVLCF